MDEQITTYKNELQDKDQQLLSVQHQLEQTLTQLIEKQKEITFNTTQLVTTRKELKKSMTANCANIQQLVDIQRKIIHTKEITTQTKQNNYTNLS